MEKKVLLGALWAIAVLAAVAGVTADLSGDVSALMNAASGSASDICATTDFQDVCEKILNASSSGSSSNINEAISAAIEALTQEVESSFNLTAKLAEAAKDPMNQKAFANCKDELTDAAENVRAVASTNGIANATHDAVYEALNFISAVTSYATACVEDIADPDLKKSMEEGLEVLYQISSIALTIMANLKDVLKSLDLGSSLAQAQAPSQAQAQPQAAGRRLLVKEGNLYGMDSEGFPAWVSTSDRKLLNDASDKPPPAFKPDVVVAQDGSGQYKSIQDALDAMPAANSKDKSSGQSSKKYVIYVKAGVYKEYVTVNKNNNNVLMYGDGPRKTIVTGSKNFVEHTGTSDTAPFVVVGTEFTCLYMGFSNTAGAIGHQAVALRVKGDHAVFYRCHFDAYQDTLYTQANHQLYRNCVISGTIDFIFGDGIVVIQNCVIIVRRPMPNQFNAVTASGRTAKDSQTGIVIHNCRIQPAKDLFPVRQQFKTYLGRPWKPYARVIFMESVMGDLVQPVGYSPWDDNTDTSLVYYGEYGNTGPGAATGDRVKWKGFHALNKAQAKQFTVSEFLDVPQWMQGIQVQYLAGLKI